MATRVTKNGGRRLREGAAILTVSKALDTNGVQAELASLQKAQDELVDAQSTLEGTEDKVAAARARVAQCDREQDRALELLARALFADGASLRKPFERFGAQALATLCKLPPKSEAAAIHDLAMRIFEDKGSTQSVREAATAANQAATAVDEAHSVLMAADGSMSEARHLRNNLAKQWDACVAALRLSARHLAEKGSPLLQSRIFPRRPKATPKKAKTTATATNQAPATS